MKKSEAVSLVREVLKEELSKVPSQDLARVKEQLRPGYAVDDITDENTLIQAVLRLAKRSAKFAQKVSKALEPYGKAAAYAIHR